MVARCNMVWKRASDRSSSTNSASGAIKHKKAIDFKLGVLREVYIKVSLFTLLGGAPNNVIKGGVVGSIDCDVGNRACGTAGFELEGRLDEYWHVHLAFRDNHSISAYPEKEAVRISERPRMRGVKPDGFSGVLNSRTYVKR